MKKKIYIVLTVIFLFVFSLLVIELSLLFFNFVISYYIALISVCIFGGIGLGLTWWDCVYVKKNHLFYKGKDKHL